MKPLGTITNAAGNLIHKYKDYGEIEIKTKNRGIVKCIVRTKDLKYLKSNNYKYIYTFRNNKHSFHAKPLHMNTSSDITLTSIIFQKDRINCPLFPVCEDPLTFDIRDVCDMLEKGSSLN